MPVFGQTVKKCRVVLAIRVALCKNHHVESTQICLVSPERLSDDALQAISAGSEPAVLLRYRKAEPCCFRAVRPGEDDEKPVAAAAGIAEYTAVRSLVRQSADLSEPLVVLR